jgi:putative ABC transport system permease protein
MKWFLFAVRNTLRNRRRSLVTVSIAALGTAAILLSGGFALSTYQALEQSSVRDTGHLIVARDQYFTKDEDTPLQYGVEDYDTLRDKILSDSDVRYVLPRVQFSGLISNGDKSVIMLGTGVDPAAEMRIKGPFLTTTAGEMLDGSETGNVPQIVIGQGLANSLNAKPGSGLTLLTTTTEGALNALDVQVKGVFTTGVPDVDKRAVIADVATAQQLLVTHKVSTVGVYLRNMESTLPVQARLQPALDSDYTVQTWRDQAVFYFAVRSLYDRIFGALGLIIAAIVVFVIANAMAMAIIERTREIGSLRALGTLPGQLVRVFAMEGATLGGVGAAIGATLALAISIALVFIHIEMPAPPGRSVGYPLTIAISPLFFGIVIVTITLLALICAAVVGRRTANQPVVEALNHV